MIHGMNNPVKPVETLMANPNIIRAVAALSVFLFLACFENPVTVDSGSAAATQNSQSKDNPAQPGQTGSAEVAITLEKTGALSKRSDISLKKLCLALVSSAKDSLRDTLVVSGNAASVVSKAYPGLSTEKTWTLYAKTVDAQDSIVHAGSVGFTVSVGKATAVKLQLGSKFVMLKAKFFPVKAGMTRCELDADGAMVATAGLPKAGMAGDTVLLAYDYLAAAPFMKHTVRMAVYGLVNGQEALLYEGIKDVTLGLNPGEDKSLGLALDYVGPWTSNTGNAQLSVTLDLTGSLTLLGELAQAPKAIGLVAYYAFYQDHNCKDESGNGNDCVLLGGAPAANRFGKLNQAWHSDGDKPIASAKHSTSLSATNAVTVSAWVLPEKLSGIQTLVGKWYSPDSYRLGITDGKYVFSVAFPGGGQWGTPVTVTADAKTGAWVHLVGVFDGKQVKLYVNGKPAASAAALGKLMQASTIPVLMGDNSTDGFKGSLDEVRIFDNPLNEKEIQVLGSPEADYKP